MDSEGTAQSSAVGCCEHGLQKGIIDKLNHCQLPSKSCAPWGLFLIEKINTSKGTVNLNGEKYAEAHRYTGKGYFEAGTGTEYLNTLKQSGIILSKSIL